jgi:hypothetical protein
MHVVFFGEKYQTESGGALGMYYDELTMLPVDFHDIGKELATGGEVHIRPATVADLPAIETQLAIVKASRTAAMVLQLQGADNAAT